MSASEKTRSSAKPKRSREPRCRVCGCTQNNACPEGCGWEPGAGNLCTVCAAIVKDVRDWLQERDRIGPTIAGLARELRWDLVVGPSLASAMKLHGSRP